MANDYLRYKYYLITRALTTYLFNSIKMVSEGKLDVDTAISNAIKSDIMLQFANEFNLSPKSVTSILAAVFADSNSLLNSYITMRTTIKTAGYIDADSTFIVVPKKSITIKTGYDTRCYNRMSLTAFVLPRACYAALLSQAETIMTAKIGVNSLIKIAIVSVIESEASVQSKLGQSLHSNINSIASFSSDAFLRLANSLYMYAKSTTEFAYNAILKQSTPLKTKIKDNYSSNMWASAFTLLRAFYVKLHPLITSHMSSKNKVVEVFKTEQNSIINNDMFSQSKLGQALHSIINSIASFENKITLEIADTLHTLIQSSTQTSYTTTLQKYNPLKTAIDEHHYSTMKVSSLVVPFIAYYTAFYSSFTSDVMIKNKVVETIKGIINDTLTSNLLATFSVPNTLNRTIEAITEMLVNISIKSQNSFKILFNDILQVTNKINVKNDLAVNTAHKQDSLLRLEAATLIVTERARLSYYASSTLQQLNSKTLQSMKYKGG